MMSMYYANGGPGPATKLLRVDAPSGAPVWSWHAAPAFQWTVAGGWQPNDDAQLTITESGEFFLIDSSVVAQVQAEMTARYNEFH